MYAIIDIADKQFKARVGEKLYVPHRPDVSEGDALPVERVLLVSDEDGTVHLGTPHVEGAHVEAKVLGHVKGDKVLVFKKKRRKRYKVKKGHRQRYTQIRIETLSMNGATRNDDAPAAEAPEKDTASEV